MKKRIAIVFVGLCNARSDNYDALYGAFDELRRRGVAVDYYLHLWNDHSKFPEGWDGDTVFKSQLLTEYIPDESPELQQRTITALKPYTKGIVRSSFSDMHSAEGFDEERDHFIPYVNLTAQFWGLQRVLHEYDLANYDMIFRWRYDLLINYNAFADLVVEHLQDTPTSYIAKAKQFFFKKTSPPAILCDIPYKIGGLLIDGNNDRWFGFNSSAIPLFKTVHTDVYAATRTGDGRGRYLEEAFLHYIAQKNLHRLVTECDKLAGLISDNFVRPNVSVRGDFFELNDDDLDEYLRLFRQDIPPDHSISNEGYG